MHASTKQITVARPIFISFPHYAFNGHFIAEDNSFPPLLPDSIWNCACASTSVYIPRQADFQKTSRSIPFVHGILPLLSCQTPIPIIILTCHTYNRLFLILSMYRQRDEPDPSRRPSRTTLGIKPTMDWAPTSQCLAGDMLSLFCLCVAPSRFARWRFFS
jgi:hypothetical protein